MAQTFLPRDRNCHFIDRLLPSWTGEDWDTHINRSGETSKSSKIDWLNQIATYQHSYLTSQLKRALNVTFRIFQTLNLSIMHWKYLWFTLVCVNGCCHNSPETEALTWNIPGVFLLFFSILRERECFIRRSRGLRAMRLYTIKVR